ncbi:unnamed protein product, partial [Ectocarpus sp. 8 AP-2014]
WGGLPPSQGRSERGWIVGCGRACRGTLPTDAMLGAMEMPELQVGAREVMLSC